MSVPAPPATPEPTQAYAAVGAAGSGMTWSLPAQAPGSQNDPTQAIPAQSGPAEPDPFDHLYRPEGGAARANPNATQVMAPVPADYGRAEYGQPAYDQPIDYQSGGGGAYGEPYEGEYDDYADDPHHGPRSNRGAKIGIGVAAGAVVVIVVSLITLGGGKSTPSAGPVNPPGSVTTPALTPSSAPSTTAQTSATTSAPSTSASSPSHIPGALQPGDTGAEVKWLQERLKAMGLYKGPINSTYDAATQAAVVAFQGRTHPADPAGIVGRSTKTALIAAGSKPTLMIAQLPGMPGFGGDKHHRGNSADIKRLQQALGSALNSGVKVTGQFDMDTFGAVVQYQSAMHMTADGVVNSSVWAALQQGRITG